jgi:hypothetical protein
MTTADDRSQNRRGWLPPRRGGYIPRAETPNGRGVKPPQGGGGVGNLPRRAETDRGQTRSRGTGGR